MTTFVLVHGAWGGAWCWKRVRPILHAAGHQVFTPTLTGVADRSHLISREVDLETHILDVANLLHWEDLSDVVLCGHSYGGAVVTGAADRVPDRIRSLVYLDAFILDDGESVIGHAPPEHARQFIEGANRVGEGFKVPPVSRENFKLKHPGDRELLETLGTMHPLGCFQQAINLGGGLARIRDIHYILATGFEPSPFPRFYERARSRGWHISTIDTGHLVMLDEPEELARRLEKIGGMRPG